jgi:hypothetical protein
MAERMRNYILSDEQSAAVVWAIAEAAQTVEHCLADPDGYSEDKPARLARERERLKTLGQLADDLGAQSAVNDCESALQAIEQELKRKPGRETRGAGAAARERENGTLAIDITRRCQNCGCTRKEHDVRKPYQCPTRLKGTYWKPWTVEEYEAAVKAAREA